MYSMASMFPVSQRSSCRNSYEEDVEAHIRKINVP